MGIAQGETIFRLANIKFGPVGQSVGHVPGELSRHMLNNDKRDTKIRGNRP